MSDAILVNFTHIGKPGINGNIVMGSGTHMEVFYASSLNIPVVLFDEERDYKDLSVWVRFHTSVICKTQEEAMKWLVSLNHKKSRHIELRQDDTTQEGFDK